METTTLLPPSTRPHDSQEMRPMSKYTKLLCWTILPAIVLMVFVISPLAVCLLPILMLPAACLLWHEQRTERHQRASLETCIWTFVLAGTVGMLVVLTVQSILTLGLAFLLFGSEANKYYEEFLRQEVDSLTPTQIATRKEMSQRWQYWVFLFTMAFGIAALSEEVLKYYSLLCARRYGSVSREHHYITYILAAAIGFSTFENIGFVCASLKVDSIPWLALTLVERIAVCSPGHLVMAALIGINVMRRDVRKEKINIGQILGLSIFFHGLFDFMLVAISSLNGNIGWVHPKKGWPLAAVLTGPLTLFLIASLILWQRLQQYQLK